MTTELFLHFYFPFTSQCSINWHLTSLSTEITFAMVTGQLLPTKLPSDELLFYSVSPAFYTTDYVLETAPELGICGKFCSLPSLAILSILTGLLNVPQGFVFGHLLASYTLPEAKFILNLCLNGSKVYVFRRNLNFRPKFPAASWKCLQGFFLVSQTQHVPKCNTLFSTSHSTFPPSRLSISVNGNTMDQVSQAGNIRVIFESCIS